MKKFKKNLSKVLNTFEKIMDNGVLLMLHFPYIFKYMIFQRRQKALLMPRSHIHGSPRRFYYGLNLTDDPGNANLISSIRMHYLRMIKN